MFALAAIRKAERRRWFILFGEVVSVADVVGIAVVVVCGVKDEEELRISGDDDDDDDVTLFEVALIVARRIALLLLLAESLFPLFDGG